MVLVPAQASLNWVQNLRPTPPTRCTGEGQQELRQHRSCARGRPAVTPRAGCMALSSATLPPTPGYHSLVCTGDSACASVPHQREAEGAQMSPEQAHSTPAQQMPRSPDGCSQQTLKIQQPAEHGSVSPPLPAHLRDTSGSTASLLGPLSPTWRSRYREVRGRPWVAGCSLQDLASRVSGEPCVLCLCGHGSQRGDVCQLPQECKPPTQQPLPRAPDGGEMSECHAEHQVPSTCQRTESERDRGMQEGRDGSTHQLPGGLAPSATQNPASFCPK